MSLLLARTGSDLHLRRGTPQRRPGTVHFPAPLAAFLLLSMFLTGCPQQKIARVEVPSENILRANEVSQEGDVAFARRDYYAALIKFLEASRLNPNSYAILNK